MTIRNLAVNFNGLPAVDRINLSVAPGEVLGIVGESGSGKSVTMMALMGLIDAPGMVTADQLSFDGLDLLKARQRRRIVGKDIAMVFQDPLTSLNPSYTVGYQIEEVLKLHEGLRGEALHRRALELLDQVGIPDAKNRLDAFPHQLSGGMSQRVMIAMAIACKPKLLIADEPTTALDVTIQAQIMELLLKLQQERGMALVLITHDLAVVAEAAQRVAVMYAGEVIETNRVPDIFARRIIRTPRRCSRRSPSTTPAPSAWPRCPAWCRGATTARSGCLFAPRCKYVVEACHAGAPGAGRAGARRRRDARALHQAAECLQAIDPSGGAR